LPSEESEDAEGAVAGPGMGNPTERAERGSWKVTSPSGFPNNMAYNAVASRTRLAMGEAECSCWCLQKGKKGGFWEGKTTCGRTVAAQWVGPCVGSRAGHCRVCPHQSPQLQ